MRELSRKIYTIPIFVLRHGPRPALYRTGKERGMSDLINRANAIKAVMMVPAVFDTQSLEPYQKAKDVTDALSALPSADAVEVVRCMDCKYFGEYNTLTQHWTCCTYWSADPYEQATIEGTDFCSCGERSEE